MISIEMEPDQDALRQAIEAIRELNQLTNELSIDLETHKQLLGLAYKELESCIFELGRATSENQKLLNSESWRLTQPIRQITPVLRRYRNRVKALTASSVTLVPLEAYANDLRVSKNIALGGRVRFKVELLKIQPGRWRRIALRFQSESPHDNRRLYVFSRDSRGKVVQRSGPHVLSADTWTQVTFQEQNPPSYTEILIIGITGSYGVEYVQGDFKNQETLSMPSFIQSENLLSDEGIYSRWIEIKESENRIRHDTHRTIQLSRSIQPVITFMIAVDNATLSTHFKTTIAAVGAQTNPSWELILLCTSETSQLDVSENIGPLHEDPRVRSLTVESSSVSFAMLVSLGLKHANGRYVAFIKVDDEICPNTIESVYETESATRGLELIYSDEDCITESGERTHPYFKPTLSPALQLSQNYIGNLACYRANTLRKVVECVDDPSNLNKWELSIRFLKFIEWNRSKVARIPKILYHNRYSSDQSDPYQERSQLKSSAFMKENERVPSVLSEVVPGIRIVGTNNPGEFKLQLPIRDPLPKVSILVPTAGEYNTISTCIDSLIALTAYNNYDITIRVDADQPISEDTQTYLNILRKQHKVNLQFHIRLPGVPFNYAAANNEMAQDAQGEYLVLLNDDTEIIDPNWLRESISTFSLPKVGVVGAQLLYANGRIQHGGALLGVDGLVANLYSGYPENAPGYMGQLRVPRNVSAVIGACLIIPKYLFANVGKLDQTNFPNAFNDTDLCLKVLNQGYYLVQNPYVTLTHRESITRGRDDSPFKIWKFQRDGELLRKRWQHYIDNDPYYNPNLSLKHSHEYEISL